MTIQYIQRSTGSQIQGIIKKNGIGTAPTDPGLILLYIEE